MNSISQFFYFTKMTLSNERWFALQIDRDFKTLEYGLGKPRLYFNSDKYVTITGVSYHNGILTVKDENNNLIDLSKPPDNEFFYNTIYKDWKEIDALYFKNDEDRIDYEPWAYNSIESLAMELGLFEDDSIQMYYIKTN